MLMKKEEGLLPSILIEAETLAEGWHKAMIAVYEKGVRALDPQYQKKIAFAYDADVTIKINNPLEEPIRHKFALYDDDRGLMQYILEVTHGIHNHWKKNPNDPNDTYWSYTYNERFSGQIPFILARIKKDWKEKRDLSSRKYTFGIWRPLEDSILEQGDPPCWQRGHLRFIKDKKGEWWLNYITEWRSRDLTKAWLENNLGQTAKYGLHKLFADKISQMLEMPIHIGAYIDKSSSLHIYGRYFEEGLENMLREMKKMEKEKNFKEIIGIPLFFEDEKKLKRLIAAQSDAESKGYGKNLSESRLKELGYTIENFSYPSDWDSWPKFWDEEPNKNLLK